MFKEKSHRGKKTRLAVLILLSTGFVSAEATYPDVNSMLEAIRPNAAVIAPELNDLIIALDAIPTPQQKFDALQTLIPLADGSLLAASEGPTRQMLEAIHDRLIQVMEQDAGYSAGDEVKAKKNHQATTNKTTDNTVTTVSKTNQSKTNNEQLPVLSTGMGPAPSIDEHQADKDTTENTAVTKGPVIPPNKGAWIQILGDDVLQRERDTVPGYKAFIYGGIIGRDWLLTPQFALGVAGGYQHARAVSRGPSGSLLGIKRLHGTLYSRYLYEFCPIFVQGALTVAHNAYDSDRKILIPPYGGVPYVRIAQADFSAWEGNATVETGLMWKRKQFKAIPKITLSYSHLDPEGYIENNAAALDLATKYRDMDALTLGGGLKLEYQNEFERAYVVPEIHGYVFHDFLTDKQMASAYFVGGGYAFLSQGAEPAPTSFEVGAGLAVHSYKNVLVTLRYDYATRTDYHRHQAFVKVRYEWA